jgi:anti-sigma factor RsiW
MSPCPNAATLQQLVDGALSDTDFAQIEPHVQTCSACQEVLDR